MSAMSDLTKREFQQFSDLECHRVQHIWAQSLRLPTKGWPCWIGWLNT